MLSDSTPDQVKPVALNNTLGALYIGSGFATMFYGVGCLQVFYMTANRSQADSAWLNEWRLLVDWKRHTRPSWWQACTACWSLPSFRQAAALECMPDHAFISSGSDPPVDSSMLKPFLPCDCTTVLIQLFFCWRIWMFSVTSFERVQMIAFPILTVPSALVSFGTNIFLSKTGFDRRLLTGDTPEFGLAFKLATAAQVAFDVMTSSAMSKHHIRPSNHVITLIILFTVNTNLFTTLLSISGLAAYLALPRGAVYGAIGLVMDKTYFNTFLAVLNSREYLKEKLEQTALSAPTNNLPYSRPKFAPNNREITGQSSIIRGEHEPSMLDTRLGDEAAAKGDNLRNECRNS
ncbi:hypothetical protein LshimejAT787_0301070 [Lyophyllum shimeji]|uniref:DUF6534 domain-containing protein n=1 Tax=Lyophyllum shimeji TaxID=47721 RepID=A0A9P3PI17_LYOSH|nr:hypothetical protein LshimejAT787_0301070 [Lyophyllum shimeji]